MNERPAPRFMATMARSYKLQGLAMLLCCLFGVAIILNVEMGGEATWFWYATLFHRGVKLYGDLHFALQPLYVIETDWWMLLAGRSCIPYEILALLHVGILCVGMFLILRESRWPDWQKAITLAGTFFVIIFFLAYRFDDFHVVADIFVVYSIALGLMLARAETTQRLLAMSGMLGVIAGLATMNRITDGGALVVAAGVCVPFLARKRKLSATLMYIAAAVLIMAAVIAWTGDTFHDYVSASILKAAGAKGGTGSILHAPLVALRDNLQRSRHSKAFIWMLCICGMGAAVNRFWKKTAGWILLAELAVAAASYGLVASLRAQIVTGGTMQSLSTPLQPLTYVLCLVVAFRYLRSRFGGAGAAGSKPWDAREVIILIPAATLLSAAASQGNGTSNSFITMAMLFLLVPVFSPFGKYSAWANPSFLMVVILAGLSGICYKVQMPYAWNSYHYAPLFRDRQWYRHPVYGPMYMQTDALQFIVPVCQEITANNPAPELLSMPYSYPNYFCNIAPWHGYVQTWFDTFTPQSVDRLMQELNTAPPQWIVYQRQLKVLHYHELEYNNGQPIEHRLLDEMIMQKIASGQWKLVDKRDYLDGDGWYIVRTRP